MNFFGIFRRRLSDDASLAWRWGSVRFLALGVTVQTAIIALPDKIAAHVPEPVLNALSTFALFCMLAAGYSRVTVKKDAPEKGDDHV